jgi:hypothetical protein
MVGTAVVTMVCRGRDSIQRSSRDAGQAAYGIERSKEDSNLTRRYQLPATKEIAPEEGQSLHTARS